jgi:hypothetical protein
VLPAIAFHLVYNTLLLLPTLRPEVNEFVEHHVASMDSSALTTLRLLFSAGCTLLAVAGLYGFWKSSPASGISPAARE